MHSHAGAWERDILCEIPGQARNDDEASHCGLDPQSPRVLDKKKVDSLCIPTQERGNEIIKKYGLIFKKVSGIISVCINNELASTHEDLTNSQYVIFTFYLD